MTVGIFGLGYVGVVNTVCFAELGHKVIGCDIKSQKVDSLMSGKSPVHEPLVDDMLQKNIAAGRITATTDAKKVVAEADVILICVGTPSQNDGTVNLDYTINTTIDIANYLSNTNRKITIAYRSTIPPGTVEDNMRPIFNEHLKNFTGTATFAFYPEFLREGSAVNDFMKAPRIVIGTLDKDITDLHKLLSYNAEIPIIVTDTYTAEFVKYVDNCFHAMKIVFVNEAYSIGSAFGIDVAKANEIFLLDRHLNISPRYLRPGMPFGGSCLPKDLRAMQHFSRKLNVQAPMLNSLLESNKQFQQRLLDKVLSKNLKKVLLVGITFKNHTDDVRESPMLKLATDIIESGKCNLKIYDEDINLTTLRIENANIVKYVENDLKQAIADAELIVVSKRFMSEVIALNTNNKPTLNFTDLDKYPTQENIEGIY